MAMKRGVCALGIGLLSAACGLVTGRLDDIRGEEARALIRRNVLPGGSQFPIEDPLAYQYGTVHVDGPEGGMLYRFVSGSEAVERIVAHWGLERVEIDSRDQLPFAFLDVAPEWWRPDEAGPNYYYFLAEAFRSGGERRVILVFDPASGAIYFVEHYSDMPGV